MDDVDFEDPSEFLTAAEVEERERLLESASSSSEAAVIEDLFERIAAERELDINARRARPDVVVDAAAPADKRHPIANFKFRGGVDDKRPWGLPDANRAPKGGARVDARPGSPAADRPSPPSPRSAVADASSPEAETAAAAAPASGEDKEDASRAAPADPLSALASAVDFRLADIESLSPSDIDARYAEHVRARVAIEWPTLLAVKDHATYSILYTDTVALLKDAGVPVSDEGLMQFHLNDTAGKAAAITGARSAAHAARAVEAEAKSRDADVKKRAAAAGKLRDAMAGGSRRRGGEGAPEK